jgi:hypothetical protein
LSIFNYKISTKEARPVLLAPESEQSCTNLSILRKTHEISLDLTVELFFKAELFQYALYQHSKNKLLY